jgi:hypothetical protein
MDVARDGDPSASKLLVLSSACHGVEGFCGSGVQVAALRDAAWRAEARRGVAVLYIHGLNPYGFSHMRRATHENVDLNRNFHDFDAAAAGEPGLPRTAPLLVPPEWPPTAGQQQGDAGVDGGPRRAGLPGAVSGGQYEFPTACSSAAGADLEQPDAARGAARPRPPRRPHRLDRHPHRPGPSGVGERIYAGRDDAAAVARCRAWWDGGGRTPITSIYDGSSTSAFLTGMMFNAAYEECPQAEYTGIALEYGTVPVLQSLHALRGEQWLNAAPRSARAVADAIRQG